LVSRDSNGWGDVRACVKAHRLGIAATFVLIAAFLLALAVSALLPGASLSHPPLAHAALAVEQLTIERQTARSDIIVVGNVVRVDKARWNGSGGKKPGQLSCLPDVMPIVYSTFYVEPSQVLKGVQRWRADRLQDHGGADGVEHARRVRRHPSFYRGHALGHGGRCRR
jgi:hypothetical protein